MKMPFKPPEWLERKAIKAWRPPGKTLEYWSQIDFLHPRYPESPMDLIPKIDSARTAPNSRDDHFSRLPTEIFEGIMIHLSTPALDAARFVSRMWWERIMTSTMLLRTFAPRRLNGHLRFEPKMKQPHMERNFQSATLRELARTLDENSHPLFLGKQPDVWRVRYGAMDIDFLPSATQEESILDIAVLSTGGAIGFLIERNTKPIPEFSVLIYMIRASIKPFLVRSIEITAEHSQPLSIKFLEGEYPVDWVLELSFQSSTYCVPGLIKDSSARVPSQILGERDPDRAFGLPFSSPSMPRSVIKSPESLKMGNWSKKSLSACSFAEGETHTSELNIRYPSWMFLEPLPLFGHGNTNGSLLERKCHWVAQNRQNSQLFVVRFQSDIEQTRASSSTRLRRGFPNIVPVHLLSSPYKHSTYKNIAVAARRGHNNLGFVQLIRIGVIWSEKADTVDCLGILFLYDIYFSTSPSISGHDIDVTRSSEMPSDKSYRSLSAGLEKMRGQGNQQEKWLAEEPISIDPSKEPCQHQKDDLICGKRVCSLPASAGGLHESLGLPAGIERPRNSGIQINGFGESDIFIWGPSYPSQSGIKLRQLNVPSQDRFPHPKGTWFNIDTARQAQQVDIPTFSAPHDQHAVVPESPPCVCELHDTRWNIEFPLTSSTRPGRFWKPSLGSSMASALTKNPSHARGTVTYVSTPLAEEAVARRSRELVAHMERLKDRTKIGISSESSASEDGS